MSASSLPLPAHLAWVAPHRACSALLVAHLAEQGVAVEPMGLAQTRAMLDSDKPVTMHDFFVLELGSPVAADLALVRQLRQHSDAGLLVISAEASDALAPALLGGADMFLAQPLTAEQLSVAVGSIYRRAHSGHGAPAAWRLDRGGRRLIAPDGVGVRLSSIDLAVLECMARADGAAVSREDLALSLGWSEAPDPNTLHATIYRLRRRISRATPALVPLQAKSRQGYLFRAPLLAQ